METSDQERQGNPDPLVLDEARREVHLGGVPVDLSRSEFALLAELMRHPGVAMSSRDLLEAMWGMAWQADTSALQVHVSRLRRKLGESGADPRHIVTVYGFGYRFEPDPPVTMADARALRLPEPDQRERAPEGTSTVLMSMDRTIAWASEHVRQLLGWTPEALIGMRHADLVHPDDPVGVDQAEELGAGHPVVVEERMRTAEGDYRRVASYLRPVVDGQGAVSGLLASWVPAEGARQAAGLSAIRLAQGSRGGGLGDPRPRTEFLPSREDLGDGSGQAADLIRRPPP